MSPAHSTPANAKVRLPGRHAKVYSRYDSVHVNQANTTLYFIYVGLAYGPAHYSPANIKARFPGRRCKVDQTIDR